MLATISTKAYFLHSSKTHCVFNEKKKASGKYKKNPYKQKKKSTTKTTTNETKKTKIKE